MHQAEIFGVLVGVDAGHRMAGHEPTDFDRELGRRQLRGEVTRDEAVAEAVAKVRRDHGLA